MRGNLLNTILCTLGLTTLLATGAAAIDVPLYVQMGSQGRGPFNPMREEVFKTVDDAKLKVWVMTPPGWAASDKRAWVAYTYGSGWKGFSQPLPKMETSYYSRSWSKGQRFGHDFGLVTVAFDYRGGKGGAAAQIGDAKSAIRWAMDHASELGIDPERLVVAGDSSGGHLAASATWFPGKYDDPADKPTPINAQAVLSFNGVLSRDTPETSPAHNCHAGNPPVLLMFGDLDGWKKTGDDFAAQAAKAGVPVHFEVYPGQNHDFHCGGVYFDKTMAISGRFMQACGVMPWTGLCLPGDRTELTELGAVATMAGELRKKTLGAMTYTTAGGGRIEGTTFISDGTSGTFAITGIDAESKMTVNGLIRVPIVLDSGVPQVEIKNDESWTETTTEQAIGGKQWSLPAQKPGTLTITYTVTTPGRYVVYGVFADKIGRSNQVLASVQVADDKAQEGVWDQNRALVGGTQLVPQALDVTAGQKVTISITRPPNPQGKANNQISIDAILLVPAITGAKVE